MRNKKTICLALLGLLAGFVVNAQPIIFSKNVTDVSPCSSSNNGEVTITIRKNGTDQFTYTIYKNFPVVTQSIGPTSDTVITFSGLEKSSYFFILKWDFPSSNVLSDWILIGGPNAIDIESQSVTDITCHGDNNGSISVVGKGETGNYLYELFNSVPVKITENGLGVFTNLSGDTYTVRVSDVTCPGSKTSSPLTVQDPPLITITGNSSTNVDCYGANNGSIQVTATGGTGALTYTISPGGSSNNNGLFTNLGPGAYTVSVTDANNCPAALAGPITITEPTVLNANVASTNLTCFGSGDGTISITSPSGGSGTYQYSINGGSSWQGSGDYTGLSAGTYDVRLRDQAVPACEVILSGSLEITQPQQLNASVASTNVTCFGGDDGSITITSPTGGSGQYEFSINGGTSWSSSGTFASLTAGTYDVRMRDKLQPSCEKVLNGSLQITQPLQMSATVSKNDVTGCYGYTNGSITISSPTGGSGIYDFTINGGSSWQGSGSFTNLAAGVYNVQMRDRNAPTCIIVLNSSLVIDQPAPLTATIATKDVTCFGNDDGEIKFSNPQGGSGSYQYSVNGGTVWRTNGTFSKTAVPPYPITAGTYSLMMRNTLVPYCQTSLGNAVIHQPGQLNATLIVTQITCNGANNGSITFDTPNGGSGSYEFSINGGTSWSDNPLFSGLSSGTYNCQIRDKNVPTCFRILNNAVSITEPAALNADVASTDVTCNGANDGTITISNPTGGWGTYEFTINGGASWQSSGNYTGLAPASYNVQMRDAANPSCVKVLNAALVITQPNALTATVSQTDVTCYGGNDGSIIISNPQGGYGTYEFSINGGSTWQVSGTFAGLFEGTYDVRMRDAAHTGCFVVLNPALVISQPSQLNANVSKTDVSGCYGNNNGAITFSSPSGGSGAYQYSINGGSSWEASGNYTGLIAGTYDVRIRDAAAPSCSRILDSALIITQPARLNGVVSSTDVSCNGGNDGTITINGASGGSGTFEYSVTGYPWQASSTFSGLPSGSYDVFIRDAATPSCQRTLATGLNITQPAILSATVVKTDVTCFGGSDGSISIANPTGGHGNYEYSINGGINWQTDSLFTGLSSGNYDVRMRDADYPGCFAILNPSLTINEPLPLSGTVDKTDVTGCYGNTNGSISIVSTAGGSGSYEFTVDGGVNWQASPVFNNLAAGTYDVRMRDAVAPWCEKILNNALVLLQPQELYGETSFTDVACYGEATGTITIENTSGGSGSYEFSINGGTTWQASSSFNLLPAGSYSVMMRDAATPSCVLVLIDPLLISQPEEIRLTIFKKDLRCNGMPDGILSITATGGTGGYQYSIDNGLNFFPTGDFSNLSAGNYSIAVKDGNGCRVDSTASLIEPDPIVIMNEVSEDETCYHSGDGWIHIFATGGAGNLLYSIDGGLTYFDNGGLFTNLSEGNYQSAVRDDSACFVTGNFLPVLSPPELIISGVSSNNVTCHSAGDGTITIIALGGTGTIRFSIDGGGNYLNNGGFFTNVPAGNYSIMIADSAGCITAGPEVVITEPPAFTSPDVAIVNISCSGQTDGSILVSPNGGTPPYTYILKEYGIERDTVTIAGSGVFTGLAANTYTVSITDANLCGTIETPPLVIVEPAPLVFDSVSVQPVLCPGTSTGGIMIYAHGGTPIHPFRSYDYTIDGGMTWDTVQFVNIPAGKYFTGVRDKRGCFVMGDTVTLVNPPALQLDSVSVVDVTGCWYDATGSITIYASGGQGALSYSIGSSYSPSNVFSGLTSGAYPLWVRDAMGCIDSVGQAIVLGPMPITASIRKHDVDGDIPGSIVISASGGGGTFEYSIDDGVSFAPTDSFPSLASGKYYVVVRDQYDCRYRDSVQIEEISSMLVVYSLTPVSCTGGNDGIISMVADLGTPPYQYSIDNGLNFYDFGYFSDLSAGDYIVLIKDTSNHRYRDTVTVQQPEPISVIATIDNANCSSLLPGFTDVGAISLNVSGGNGGYTFAWTKDGKPVGTSQNITELTAGLYTVQVTDSKNCSSTKSYTVGSDPAKNVSINSIPDQNVCSNVALDLTASSPQNVGYKWIRISDGAEISSQPTVTIPPGESGTFVAVAYNTFNCAAYDTFNVRVYPIPALSMVRDTMILGGVTMTLPLQLTDTAGLSETEFNWSNDIWLDDASSMNPQFTPDKSSNEWDFVVTASTSHNCVAIDTITVHVLWELMVPNGFSPNNDGYNDVWFIPAAQFVRVDVEVFNRWGEKVYSAKNYKNDWDGKYKGKPLGIGTYYYVVTFYTGGKVKTLTGPLTILVQPK